MKSNKSSFKSFRKKVVSKEGVDAISPGIRHGETLIPKGSSIATIELPETKETFTYEIINSDAMTGDIKVAATEGSLKGLILNSTAGTLSVTPVPANCKQVLFETTIEDGSYIETLSDGSDWFLWSFGIGNGLGVSTNTYIRGNVGLIGGGSGIVFESIILGPTYEPVIITSSVVTVEYPGGVATHDISFSGTAEPGSTLKIFDISNTLIGTVDPVANDGSWSFTVSGLTNGSHEYTFKAFVGVDFINQSAVWSELLNGGSINFSCSQIQVEVGTTNPNFTSFPTVEHVDENGVTTPIANTNVVSTTYSDASSAGNTFNVVFEFTYDSVTYQRTVTGNTIVNLVQPALPTISTVDGSASGVPISVTIADISGTALPNANVIVWVDDSNTSTPVTANGAGQWTISSYDFGFTNNQTIVLYAQQQTVNGTRWSNNSTQFNVVYQQNVLAQPAVTDIDGLTSGGFTNNIDPLTINGTGVVGATVTVASAGSTLTTNPSTITVDSNGDWTAELPNMSDETLHTITAQQTKAGFTQSQQSNGFIINVDRTPPVLAAVLDTILYLDNVVDTLPTATDAFSSVVVTAVYSPALVNAEDDYTATYTATDAAGNTAQNSRTISVTTQAIVPTILVVTDNGDGTATITGEVVGTYADNLTVQIVINNVDNGTPLDVINEAFSVVITLANGTYQIQAKTVNSVSEVSTLTTVETLVMAGAVASPFIENSSNFTLFGASSLDNDVGNLIYKHGTSGTDNYATGKWSDGLTHDGSGFSYTSYTLSFWVKFNTLPANSDDVFIFSARDASHNGLEFMMDTAGGGEKTLQVHHSDAPTNNATRSLTDTYTSVNAVTAFQGVWINFVAIVSNNDENLNVYINESLRRTQTPNGYSDTRLNGVKYVNDITNANSTFTIGDRWDGSNDHTTDIEIDSIQIMENVILTEAQANAIAADSTRQMTIETAASLHFSAELEEQGTLNGSASIVNGVLVSPSLGDYTSMPNADAFKSSENQTISFWFRSTYTPANNVWMRFIHTHVMGAGPNGFFIEMRSTTSIFFKGASQGLSGNTSPAAIAPYALNDGDWHQITLSWEDLGTERLRIWVDGAPMTVLDETLVGSGNDNKSTLFIGARQFNSPMEMDKVGITEEFIDDAEALARYNSEVLTLAP